MAVYRARRPRACDIACDSRVVSARPVLSARHDVLPLSGGLLPVKHVTRGQDRRRTHTRNDATWRVRTRFSRSVGGQSGRGCTRAVSSIPRPSGRGRAPGLLVSRERSSASPCPASTRWLFRALSTTRVWAAIRAYTMFSSAVVSCYYYYCVIWAAARWYFNWFCARRPFGHEVVDLLSTNISLPPTCPSQIVVRRECTYVHDYRDRDHQ